MGCNDLFDRIVSQLDELLPLRLADGLLRERIESQDVAELFEEEVVVKSSWSSSDMRTVESVG